MRLSGAKGGQLDWVPGGRLLRRCGTPCGATEWQAALDSEKEDVCHAEGQELSQRLWSCQLAFLLKFSELRLL